MSVNLPDPKVLPLTPRKSFCPHPACPNRGQRGRGNIVIHSRRERRYKCTTCGKTFAATQGTVYDRKQHGHDLITLVLTLLAYGCPLQALVSAFLLDERTVGQWVREAGTHGQQVHEHLVEAGQVATRHVQADELWVKRVGMKVWQAMALAVESRLWLGGAVSAVRDQALITRLVARVRASVASLDILVLTCINK
jgi:transposase-like protein